MDVGWAVQCRQNRRGMSRAWSSDRACNFTECRASQDLEAPRPAPQAMDQPHRGEPRLGCATPCASETGLQLAATIVARLNMVGQVRQCQAVRRKLSPPCFNKQKVTERGGGSHGDTC